MGIKSLSVLIWLVVLGGLVFQGRLESQMRKPLSKVSENDIGTVTYIGPCHPHKKSEKCNIVTPEGTFPDMDISHFPKPVALGDYLRVENWEYTGGKKRIYYCQNNDCSVTRAGGTLLWTEVAMLSWLGLGLLAFLVFAIQPFKRSDEPYDNRQYLS